MMCYYLNVQFQGQRAKTSMKFKGPEIHNRVQKPSQWILSEDDSDEKYHLVKSETLNTKHFFCGGSVCLVGCLLWRNSPQWVRASSFTRFLDHTQRRTTVDRTPLDE